MEGEASLDYDRIHGPRYVDLLRAHEDDNADEFFDTAEGIDMEWNGDFKNEETIPEDFEDETDAPSNEGTATVDSVSSPVTAVKGNTSMDKKGQTPVTRSSSRNTPGRRTVERSHPVPQRQKSVEKRNTPSKPGASNLKKSQSFSAGHNKNMDAVRQKYHTRGRSNERPQKQRLRSSNTTEADKASVTVPTTPKLLKRKLPELGPSVKNSEQLELERIANFRQELAKKRKLAQKSCEVALKGKAPVCPVQAKPITVSEEFKFETDSRIKAQGKDTKNETSANDFVRTLRSDTAHQANAALKNTITKPKPFNLTETRKRRLPDLDEEQAKKYETMAEQLAKFTKTPERFRSKSKATEQKRSTSKPEARHAVTVPKTPQFETRTRSRPVHGPTKEELEQKEVDEMQRHQFKAHPVNHKILKDGSVGIKKVPVKPPTVPEEFHLTSVKSHHTRHRSEDHYQFHAQPVNIKILEGTVGVKEAEKLPPTVPESPAFALKHRARMPLVEVPKEEKPNLRPRPAPHFGVPFQPQFSHKITEPAPFAFEEREKRRAADKKKKMTCILEEEKKNREFHANPLPDLAPHLPPKKSRAPTKFAPFALETDQRGVKKTEDWNRKMHEEMEHQTEKATFKARQPTVLEHEPFIPQKENKYTSEISEFEFNTAKRLAKREAFEQHRKTKQDEMDDVRNQVERMKEEEERAEIERMRREAVHKANPIKQYKGVAIKRGEKPLTEPRSPRFQTDTRLRSRMLHAESFMSA